MQEKALKSELRNERCIRSRVSLLLYQILLTSKHTSYS